MLFKNLIPLVSYKGAATCPVPKGTPLGRGELLFLLSPTQNDSIKFLGPGSFLNYREGLYKRYFSEYLFYEKIGVKQVREKVSAADFEAFDSNQFESDLAIVRKGSLNGLTKAKRNLIVDLGKWNELHFLYRRKTTPKLLATNYLNFIAAKVNDERWDGYNKTIIIDAALWEKQLQSKIIFATDTMNNPITILLFALYKDLGIANPGDPKASKLAEQFKGTSFLIMNSKTKTLIYVPAESLIKDNFGTIKARIATIAKEKIDVEEIPEVDQQTEIAQIKSDVLNPDVQSKKIVEIRQELKNKIAKNFVGDVDDAIDVTKEVSTELDEAEDESTPDIDTQSEELNHAIDTEVDNILRDIDTDDLDNFIKEHGDEVAKDATKNIAKNVFAHSFVPVYDKKTQNAINKLAAIQSEVIKEFTPKEMLESKQIDEIDVSEAVNTPNSDYLRIKFAKLDRSYNEKKKEYDIDHMVTQMSSASRKVFVTSKTVTDTSDQLTLKETRKYHLQDEAGKKFTLEFDLPKVIDDCYVYINGNKKILEHQLVALPIVKNKSNEVKLNSSYKKVICDRIGRSDVAGAAIIKLLNKHQKKYETKTGISSRKNKGYTQTIENELFSNAIYSFTVKGFKFITAMDDIIKSCESRGINLKHKTKDHYPIAVNYDTKEVIYLDALTESYADKILALLDAEDVAELEKYSISKRQYHVVCKIMEKNIPLALLVLHQVGLTEMLKRAGIEEIWVPMEEKSKLREYSNFNYGKTQLADGYLVWKRKPSEHAMLMNGMNQDDYTMFSREEMDSKDTYIFMLGKYYSYSNMSFNLDHFNDFMVDPISKEILEDKGLPTNWVDILLYANKLLTTMDYTPELDMRNLKLRGAELISVYVYDAIANAYNQYKKSTHNKYKNNPISIKKDAIMSEIMKSALTEEASIINPFYELEKTHGTTFKGKNGIGEDRAFTLDKRAYTESMLGVLGITTPNDANVGIIRGLTLEPKIVSTRGYIDVGSKSKLDDLSAANLLTPGELLTPLGIEHDDPARTAMAVKQSKYMIPIDNSEPGIITNGVDRALPYHLSKEFVIVAEDDGVVVEDTPDLTVVKYKNGRYQTIDKTPATKKNGSSGFFIVNSMKCDKKLGDKVKKNEVIGYEAQAFQKNTDDLSATMTRGPFVKIALLPRWDCYEDSNPVTAKTSDDMATTMAMEQSFVLKPLANVKYIANVGDMIHSGDPLISFEEFDSIDQGAINDLMSRLSELGDEFIESMVNTRKAHYTGEIVDIKIYSTVGLDDMSESMKEVVKGYYKKLNKKISIMQKYKNPEDNNYYMSGQRINEYPEPIKPDDKGMLKGNRISDDGGVVFCFYIKFKDYIKKGDKITAEFALKGIDSQVIEPGLEAYSEYRPDEEIGLMIAPHSPTARKTTAIFKSMFINKLVIEKKRQLMDYWKSIRDSLQ